MLQYQQVTEKLFECFRIERMEESICILNHEKSLLGAESDRLFLTVKSPINMRLSWLLYNRAEMEPNRLYFTIRHIPILIDLTIGPA